MTRPPSALLVTVALLTIIGVTPAHAAPAPTISGFSPASGPVGTSVTITGSHFTGATGVKFNGTASTFTVDSSSQITAAVPTGATTGSISAITDEGTATSSTSFTVTPAAPPTIGSFSPTSGPVGTSVTLNGTNFTGATGVKFNGASVSTFTVNSSTKITATVPTGATTGKISVTTPAGTATSSASFTVKPKINSFNPTSGDVGTSVTIKGTTFNGTTALKFNGTKATFTINSATKITAKVPAGATSGPISVTTPSGTGTSSTSFTVTTGPTITSFSPTSGSAGASVTINGTSFTGATAVKFNGTSATFTVNSSTKITATVPSSATTGKISVTTPSGTAASSGNFTVKPTISSFSPTSGSVGATVTIIGTGFTGVTAVNFHGTASDSFAVDSSTQITARVPADATTGSIAVTTAGGTATSSAPFTVLHRRSVTLSLTGGLTASGFVTSNDGFDACESGVPVKIQRHHNDHWRTLVEVVTRADGSYSAKIADASGRYRARASRTVLPSDDVCNRSTSRRIRHRASSAPGAPVGNPSALVRALFARRD